MTLIKKGLPEFHPSKPNPGSLGTPEFHPSKPKPGLLGTPEFHPRKPKPGLLGTPELPRFEKQSQEPRAKGQWLEAGSRRK
jgi:hypothetical protein